MVLHFLSATDVGRLAVAAEEGGTGSDASEWQLRERREREEELRAEAAVLGTEDKLGGGEGLPLFLPTPCFMVSADEEEMGHVSFVISFVILFGAHLLSCGTCLGGGQKESLRRAATARTADGKNG